ncbi:MAG: YigZ family protein [Christensenellales bacterium]
MSAKEYVSVKECFCDEQVINKSRFITTLMPISDYDDAMEKIKQITCRYSDATHNCYAFISNDIATEQRFSDDGEPQGTAGLPMLEVLKKRNCLMTLAVVTRYFGGIKLGANGLVGAYSSGVSKALDKARTVLNKRADELRVECEYGVFKKLSKLLENHGCLCLDTQYDDKVITRFAVDENDSCLLQSEIADLTQGRAKISVENNAYYQFEI